MKDKETIFRGQTSIDLLIAVTLFFLAIAILLANSVGLFFPSSTVTEQTTEKQAIVERVEYEYLGNATSGYLSPEKIVEEINNRPNATEIGEKLGTNKDVYIKITPITTDGPGNYTRVLLTEYHGDSTNLSDGKITLPVNDTAEDNLDQIQTTNTRFSILGGTYVEVVITLGEDPA